MEESKDITLTYNSFTEEDVYQRWKSRFNNEEMPRKMWKINPSSEELASEYNEWCYILSRECAEETKQDKDIDEKKSRYQITCPLRTNWTEYSQI
jgi:hypothetical protein